jgi:hypothetical protein
MSADNGAIQNLRDAKAALDEANQAYRTAIRRAFPKGSMVTSTKHGRVTVTVEDHSYTDLIVRSETGKRYRVDVYHILEARTR